LTSFTDKSTTTQIFIAFVKQKPDDSNFEYLDVVGQQLKTDTVTGAMMQLAIRLYHHNINRERKARNIQE